MNMTSDIQYDDYENFMKFCSFLPYLYYINGGVTIILFPLMIYIVLNHSPKNNKTIKWLILNIVTTSFVLSLAYTLYVPVIISPSDVITRGGVSFSCSLCSSFRLLMSW